MGAIRRETRGRERVGVRQDKRERLPCPHQRREPLPGRERRSRRHQSEGQRALFLKLSFATGHFRDVASIRHSPMEGEQGRVSFHESFPASGRSGDRALRPSLFFATGPSRGTSFWPNSRSCAFRGSFSGPDAARPAQPVRSKTCFPDRERTPPHPPPSLS